jgi:hypothetical protein
MDLTFIIVLAVVIQYCINKHGTGKPIDGVGDFIGLCIAAGILLCLIRIPTYLLLYGARFPFNPSEQVQSITGIGAIVFWGVMLYWRIPMRLLGRE